MTKLPARTAGLVESARIDLSPTAEAYRREYPKESAFGAVGGDLGGGHAPDAHLHLRPELDIGCKFRSRQDLA